MGAAVSVSIPTYPESAKGCTKAKKKVEKKALTSTPPII